MVRIKLVVSALGVACAAIAVLSSSALAVVKAVPSFREEGTGKLLGAGDPLVFKTTTTSVVFATSEGNITCEDGRLNGTLQNNGLKADNFVLTGTKFSSSGGPCSSTTPLGAGKITAEPPKGGWAGLAKIKGKATVTGPIQLTGKFEPSGATITCTWSAKKLKATFVPNGLPIQVTVSGKFKRTAIVPGCPKTAALTGTFALSSRGTPVVMS
jgi:hypothetical protein